MTESNDEFFECNICKHHTMQVGLHFGGTAMLCLRDADSLEEVHIELSFEDCQRLANHLLKVTAPDYPGGG